MPRGLRRSLARQLKRLRRIAWTCLLLILVGGAGGLWFMDTQQRAMDRPLAISDGPFVYTVRRGATIGTVARDLEAAGLIGSALRLELHARWSGAAKRIKAGEYALEPGLTASGLLELLVAGTVVQHAVTIIEGWTFRELRRRVAETDALVHTLNDLADGEVMARLGLAGMHPEGRFFPETYHFPSGTTDVQLLRRAHDTMVAYLDSAWARRTDDLPLASPDEALILASIVEKETGAAEERARIAGVFISRLRRGMRLETDPTVIYGLGDEFDGNLRKADMKRDTPYNTYLHKGLPPTPIAIAGGASIDAVVAPLVDGSLFFVAKGDGRHEFSATYADHRKAVRRYQIRRGSSGRKSDDAGE